LAGLSKDKYEENCGFSEVFFGIRWRFLDRFAEKRQVKRNGKDTFPGEVPDQSAIFCRGSCELSLRIEGQAPSRA
jgi:hypothetical protein